MSPSRRSGTSRWYPAWPASLLGGLDADFSGHRVAIVGPQGHCRITDIRRFDAEHSRPFVVAEIGHRPSLLHPWIPDDRRVRSTFRNRDPALHTRIVNHARGLGADIDAVGFTSEPDRVRIL